MKRLFILQILILFCFNINAQLSINQLGFNYSALVRDQTGKVQPNTSVYMRFTFLQGANGASTNSPYIETQTIKTDAYGFANLVIGQGTSSQNFSSLDFSTINYWILIEVSFVNNGTYAALAKEALNAVPYAKVAGALVGAAAIPPGTIVAFGGDTSHIPTGWLLCNGRSFSVSDPIYINLFNAIQFNWGSPTSTKFNIPNLAGMFLRGTSNGTNNDPDKTSRTAIMSGGNIGDGVGSYQTDTLRSHIHAKGFGTLSQSSGAGYAYSGSTSYPGGPINTGSTGGNETRPVNVYVNYIIKL